MNPNSNYICFASQDCLREPPAPHRLATAQVMSVSHLAMFALKFRGPGKVLALSAYIRWLASGGRIGMGQVLVIVQEGLCVHFSNYFRPGPRCAFAASDVVEIGPCWTDPDYRGLGLYRFAIKHILHDLRTGGGAVMISRSDNVASVRGILTAGLLPKYWLSRKKSPLGLYSRYEVTGNCDIGQLNTFLKDQVLSVFVSDKSVEERRYSSRVSGEKSVRTDDSELGKAGAEVHSASIRTPYTVYHQKLREKLRRGDYVLELCGGTGIHSLTAAEQGARMVVSDISAPSLNVALRRADRHGVAIDCAAADGERLPFIDGSFDAVICAGGMSYCDPHLMINEIARVLKPGGHFIAVDSFNHSWIYRINRYFGYLRGQRSWLTLKRMPSQATVLKLCGHFKMVSISYHGIITFTMPLIKKLVGEEKAARISDGFDRKFRFLERCAFKVVLCFQKPPVSDRSG